MLENKNLSYSFLQSVAIALGILLQNLIAAWYLSPSELGAWAILMMLYRLVTPIVEGGWSRAIISQKDLNDNQLQTLFTYNLGLSLLLLLSLCLSANAIAKFFQVNELANYICALSLIFLPVGIGALPSTLLKKNLQITRLAQAQIVSAVVEFCLFLLLLHFGFRLWALLLPFIVKMFLLNFIYLLLQKMKFSIKNDFESVRTICTTASYDLGAQLLNYFYTNIDNILVGRFLGQAALGFYSLAWDLTVKPVSFINPIIMRVAFPMMAKAEDLKAAYQRTLIQIARIQVPIYLFLAIIIPYLIPLVYGETWKMASQTAQILCFVALLRAIAEPGASVLVIKGKVKIEFYFQIFNTLLTFLSIFIFLYFDKSIENVAAAMLVAHIIIVSLWLLEVRDLSRTN
jgi:O-antigen/teichoic acid export membrane protein